MSTSPLSFGGIGAFSTTGGKSTRERNVSAAVQKLAFALEDVARKHGIWTTGKIEPWGDYWYGRGDSVGKSVDVTLRNVEIKGMRYRRIFTASVAEYPTGTWDAEYSAETTWAPMGEGGRNYGEGRAFRTADAAIAYLAEAYDAAIRGGVL